MYESVGEAGEQRAALPLIKVVMWPRCKRLQVRLCRTSPSLRWSGIGSIGGQTPDEIQWLMSIQNRFWCSCRLAEELIHHSVRKSLKTAAAHTMQEGSLCKTNLQLNVESRAFYLRPSSETHTIIHHQTFRGLQKHAESFSVGNVFVLFFSAHYSAYLKTNWRRGRF